MLALTVCGCLFVFDFERLLVRLFTDEAYDKKYKDCSNNEEKDA